MSDEFNGNYEQLALAIIRQAINDLKYDCYNIEKQFYREQCYENRRNAITFFRSEWFKDLCIILNFEPNDVRWFAFDQAEKRKKNT